MVGIIKDSFGENGDRIVVPAVEEICKNFGTIAIPSITITLKANFIFGRYFIIRQGEFLGISDHFE